jgi:hypothetical protein
MNWAMKNIIGIFLGFIKSKAENLPEIYVKLMEERKDFYDSIRDKIGRLIEKND